MTVVEAVGVALAGVAAGGINTVVGSGALIAFPTLLAVGYLPVVANVSCSLGLAPGSLSGAYGYRRELAGQAGRLRTLLPGSILGSIIGAILLLVLPGSAFSRVAPVLIVLAMVLVVAQPWLKRWLADRQRHERGGFLLWIGVFFNGIYGGYFGAGQGVLMMGLMGVLMGDDMQRMNAVKNVLIAAVYLISGIIFVFAAHVAWPAVLLLAVGSVIGGQIGAKIGRKLPQAAVRAIIVAVGLTAFVKLVFF